jgi:iron(III) transport system substrate-binding protein
LIPGSIALIQGAPHPQQAQALIDYLLSAKVAQDLVDSGFNHLPIHPSIKPAEACLGTQTVRLMHADFAEAFTRFEQAQTELREIFIK